jgi:hypothetical protein
MTRIGADYELDGWGESTPFYSEMARETKSSRLELKPG